MLPAGAVLANHDELQHNNTYGDLPEFYIDRPFSCRDSGVEEIWTAIQQKWWYEVAKGHIDSYMPKLQDENKKGKSETKGAYDRNGGAETSS